MLTYQNKLISIQFMEKLFLKEVNPAVKLFDYTIFVVWFGSRLGFLFYFDFARALI